MNEKKWKLSLPVAIVILGVCILIGASNISSAIRDSSDSYGNSEVYVSELTRLNENIEEFLQTLQESN